MNPGLSVDTSLVYETIMPFYSLYALHTFAWKGLDFIGHPLPSLALLLRRSTTTSSYYKKA
jgi:hypothetical protein